MIGDPSVNEIENAYGSQQGLQALAQKVKQEPKGPEGLPSDLKDLLALDDLQQKMQGAQTQQNLQNPTNMPTVADQLKQKIMAMEQARQQQEMMRQQALMRAQQQSFNLQGYGQYQPSAMQMQPMQPTQGMPQQPQAAAAGGLMNARIPSGMFHFSHGGILHFDKGGDTDKDKALAAVDSALPEEMPEGLGMSRSDYLKQRQTAIDAINANLAPPKQPLTLGTPITNREQPNIYSEFTDKTPVDPAASAAAYQAVYGRTPNLQAAPQSAPQIAGNMGRGGQGGPSAAQLAGIAVASGAPKPAPQPNIPTGAPVVAAQPGAQGPAPSSGFDNPYSQKELEAIEELKKAKRPEPTQDEYQAALRKSYESYGVDPKQAYEDHKKELAKIDAAREAANAAHERANKAQGLENVWHTLANMRGGRASEALGNSAIAGQRRVDEQRAAEEAYQQQNMTNMAKQQAARQALDDAQIAFARGDYKGYQDSLDKARTLNLGADTAVSQGLGRLATNYETNQTRRENAQIADATRRENAKLAQMTHADALAARMDQREADRDAALNKTAATLAMSAAQKAIADPMNYNKYKGMTTEEVAAMMHPRILQMLKGGQSGMESAPKDISAQVQAAFGTYEPNKYDYRVNPDTGVLQRKLKG